MDMSRPPPLRHVGTEKTVVDDGAGMPGMAPPTDDGAGFFHPALEHPSLDMALDVEWDQMEMEEGAAAVDGDGWDYPPEPEEGGVVDDMDHEDPAGQDDDAQNETRELPVMDKLQWGHPVRIVGSMMTGPVQLHLCPQCDQVINKYGRITACKHTYCASCAYKIQSREATCLLCVEFRFENPPGSTKSKPIVDYFSLDQDMYICDAVKSGRTERRCGRGFLSESNKQSCTHEVQAFRSRLNSDPSKQPRSGGVGTGRSGGLRQAHERLGPRNQPYPHDGFAQRQQDLSVGGENRRAVIGSFREQAREMQGGYRDPDRFMVQRGGPVDPRGGGGSYRDDSLFRDRYGSAGGPGYDDRAVRWDGGAATAAARPRQSMPWDARDPSTPRDPPTREVRYY
eukprot:m.131445 g.131445  ORF g.131445 m.131445 type:complete len:396 (+) comp13754_c0_seq1:340-1527(+)